MRRLINQIPGRASSLWLGLLPFAGLLLVYVIASDARLAENPNDRLLPSLGTIADTITRLATVPDERSGAVLLWRDTLASLERLGLGILVSALGGLVFGISIGALPYARAAFAPLVGALSMIPPMAVLPILFIVFGLGEVSKVVLIVFGVAPFLMRDLALRIRDIPDEQLVKAQTLGANSWLVILRVVLPQVLPRLIDGIRLSIGAAWLFLIAAEAIASTEGLGYRIFLVRRYLAMDVILPYVVWITFLAFAMDWLLRMLRERAFPWYQGDNARK